MEMGVGGGGWGGGGEKEEREAGRGESGGVSLITGLSTISRSDRTDRRLDATSCLLLVSVRVIYHRPASALAAAIITTIITSLPQAQELCRTSVCYAVRYLA